MSAWTRAFRITFPDGYTLHGAQFPSGRCVLDDDTSGLVEAATAVEHLSILKGRPLARVVWADGGDDVGPPDVVCICNPSHRPDEASRKLGLEYEEDFTA